ncbi:hypothetical protein L596_012875 [Steinernema carpocapsae]|uniref:Uncharacterized protein n=1 Tax=Steinernema carpocapsae TaxID=34508 RepID=A0A4U5NYJ0_STECR|nr:hypothetical protein L596_012875 [Steinernema carpocapsae]
MRFSLIGYEQTSVPIIVACALRFSNCLLCEPGLRVDFKDFLVSKKKETGNVEAREESADYFQEYHNFFNRA